MHQTHFPTIPISILELEAILQHIPNRAKVNLAPSQIKQINILIYYNESYLTYIYTSLDFFFYPYYCETGDMHNPADTAGVVFCRVRFCSLPERR